MLRPQKADGHKARTGASYRAGSCRSGIFPALIVSAASMLVLGTGCQNLPERSAVPPSHALNDTASTTLGRAVAEGAAQHPGETGFHPLATGAEAFVARLVLARTAERSLDLQYYLFHNDETGHALLGELIRAAERGVRVRLLIDDIDTQGLDEAFAIIAAHPNIEVRLFNPFKHRSARWMDFATDFRRVNRRMHNKSFIADNQTAIVGGRNVGAEYFSARPDVDFSDLDLLILGPTVHVLSGVFDEYWNSSVTYPIADLHPKPPDPARKAHLREQFIQSLEHIQATPYARGLAETDLARSLRDRSLSLYWGPAEVIADKPEKVILPRGDASTHALPAFDKFLSSAREELLLVSPYFVPGPEGTRLLIEAAKKGLRVRILTNSYLATDVRAVHAGYVPYRKKLVEAGIEIFELKPNATGQSAERAKDSTSSSSQASLHAKTYMVDTRKLFVGSLNFDPRSAVLNTEMGVIVESDELCGGFRKRFETDVLDVAYHLQIDRNSGKLEWVTRETGREVRLTREPGVGFFTKISLFFLRVLPVEEQL